MMATLQPRLCGDKISFFTAAVVSHRLRYSLSFVGTSPGPSPLGLLPVHGFIGQSQKTRAEQINGSLGVWLLHLGLWAYNSSPWSWCCYSSLTMSEVRFLNTSYQADVQRVVANESRKLGKGKVWFLKFRRRRLSLLWVFCWKGYCE